MRDEPPPVAQRLDLADFRLGDKCDRCGGIASGGSAVDSFYHCHCPPEGFRVRQHESLAFSRRYGTAGRSGDGEDDPGWDNVVRAYEEDR